MSVPPRTTPGSHNTCVRLWACGFSSAFTLVELLVVIGIIALLVGILLPSLSRARAKSQQVACMSNMHQIGIALLMYSNDNHDHYPDNNAVGNWAYRRRPGLRDPLDPSSRPEWIGLPALLHGIKISDYNTGMTIPTIANSLQPILGKSGRYLPATSNVWVCPAFPEKFAQYGNTYCYNVNTLVGGYTSVQRGQWTFRQFLVAWDNSNFMPYVCGTIAPTTVTGYTISPAIYPHPGSKGATKARNELYFDGHVSQVTP